MHVCAPGALAMVIATLFLNGSIFEEGMVRTICDGAAIDGMNCTPLLVMWMLGSKAFPACMVNSPHLRKPEKVVIVVSLKLSWLDRFGWVVDARMCTRTWHVMGILGVHLHSPMYLLMPLMMCWSKSDSHPWKGSPVSTWVDCRCVTYNLIVLGWSLLAPPSQATHLSSTV